MSILKNALIKATGNRFMQRVLERTVRASQDLMGIGSGDGVLSSGEQVAFAVLRQRSSPPYCIFDVGANQGQFLRLTLDHIGVEDFSIHCFEPGRETFKILAESAAQDARIRLNNIGMGKEKCEAILHFDRPGSGLASLTKRRLDHFAIDFNGSEKVEISTIDSYCAENAISRIHLLKLDIEGHELDAFSGAHRMFEAKAIDVVTFEFGGCNIDTRSFFQDFWYFFNALDMAIFRITPSGYLYPLDSYKELDEQFRTTNCIAMAKG
jgi:FkbM family methyltransferase